jgi:MFS family permease
MNYKSPAARRIAVSAVFFFYGLSYASWTARIPTIQQNLRLSEAGLGGVLLGMPVGSFIMLPFSGWLVARAGSRKVVICAAFLYCCLLACIGFASTTIQLVISLFFFGAFGNMLNISINTQAIGVEAIYKRRILSSFHGVWSLAGLAGASVGGYILSKNIGTGAHLLGVSVFAAVTMLFCIPYLITEDTNRDNKRPVFVKPDKRLFVLGMIAFCSMMCQGAMFDWTGIYFKKVLLADKSVIGVGLTAFTISMAATRFIADWLSHHAGLKKMLFWSGLLPAVGLLTAVIFPNIVTATIGFMLVGVGVSPVLPLLFSVAGKTVNMSPGMAIAAVSTLGFVGLLIGPPLIGFIAGAASLRISFLVLAAMGLAVTVLAGKVEQEL